MKDYYFSEDVDQRQPSAQGKINEQNARFLLNAYMSILLTYETISDQLLKG